MLSRTIITTLTEVLGHAVLEHTQVGHEVLSLVSLRLGVQIVYHGLQLLGETNAILDGSLGLVQGVLLEEPLLDSLEEAVGNVDLQSFLCETEEGQTIGAISVDFEPTASS